MYEFIKLLRYSPCIKIVANGKGTNINLVAKKAGISVGSIYKYFDSKEDLFLMIIDICIQVLENTLKGIVESDDNIMNKFEGIFREIQRTSRESKELICLYNEMTTIGNKNLVKKVSRDIEYKPYIKWTAQWGD